MPEQTLIQKMAENWPWIAGIGSTSLGAVALVRYKIRRHYENPLMRRDDMMQCKDDLCVSIKGNKAAIDKVEQKIEDEFVRHNEGDRKRYENLLMAVAGMQNGRNGG